MQEIRTELCTELTEEQKVAWDRQSAGGGPLNLAPGGPSMSSGPIMSGGGKSRLGGGKSLSAGTKSWSGGGKSRSAGANSLSGGGKSRSGGGGKSRAEGGKSLSLSRSLFGGDGHRSADLGLPPWWAGPHRVRERYAADLHLTCLGVQLQRVAGSERASAARNLKTHGVVGFPMKEESCVRRPEKKNRPAVPKAVLTGTPPSSDWCSNGPPGGTSSPDTPGGGTPRGTRPGLSVRPRGAATMHTLRDSRGTPGMPKGGTMAARGLAPGSWLRTGVVGGGWVVSGPPAEPLVPLLRGSGRGMKPGGGAAV
ncbi:hypothetical protein B566_EDAN004665 [Ephemera danica]|nr:hypothetical protein B566_EDAN004665 [Ephemera danica]